MHNDFPKAISRHNLINGALDQLLELSITFVYPENDNDINTISMRNYLTWRLQNSLENYFNQDDRTHDVQLNVGYPLQTLIKGDEKELFLYKVGFTLFQRALVSSTKNEDVRIQIAAVTEKISEMNKTPKTFVSTLKASNLKTWDHIWNVEFKLSTVSSSVSSSFERGHLQNAIHSRGSIPEGRSNAQKSPMINTVITVTCGSILFVLMAAFVYRYKQTIYKKSHIQNALCLSSSRLSRDENLDGHSGLSSSDRKILINKGNSSQHLMEENNENNEKNEPDSASRNSKKSKTSKNTSIKEENEEDLFGIQLVPSLSSVSKGSTKNEKVRVQKIQNDDDAESDVSSMWDSISQRWDEKYFSALDAMAKEPINSQQVKQTPYTNGAQQSILYVSSSSESDEMCFTDSSASTRTTSISAATEDFLESDAKMAKVARKKRRFARQSRGGRIGSRPNSERRESNNNRNGQEQRDPPASSRKFHGHIDTSRNVIQSPTNPLARSRSTKQSPINAFDLVGINSNSSTPVHSNGLRSTNKSANDRVRLAKQSSNKRLNQNALTSQQQQRPDMMNDARKYGDKGDRRNAKAASYNDRGRDPSPELNDEKINPNNSNSMQRVQKGLKPRQSQQQNLDVRRSGSHTNNSSSNQGNDQNLATQNKPKSRSNEQPDDVQRMKNTRERDDALKQSRRATTTLTPSTQRQKKKADDESTCTSLSDITFGDDEEHPTIFQIAKAVGSFE